MDSADATQLSPGKRSLGSADREQKADIGTAGSDPTPEVPRRRRRYDVKELLGMPRSPSPAAREQTRFQPSEKSAFVKVETDVAGTSRTIAPNLPQPPIGSRYFPTPKLPLPPYDALMHDARMSFADFWWRQARDLQTKGRPLPLPAAHPCLYPPMFMDPSGFRPYLMPPVYPPIFATPPPPLASDLCRSGERRSEVSSTETSPEAANQSPRICSSRENDSDEDDEIDVEEMSPSVGRRSTSDDTSSPDTTVHSPPHTPPPGPALPDLQTTPPTGQYVSPPFPMMTSHVPYGTAFPFPVSGRRPRDPSKPPPLKKYKCDLCGKGFSRSNTLVTHRRIHTGEKPFKCELCGRAFRQPGNLTRHRLTHTTVKPYVCPVCHKAFNRASNLQTHMRTHANFKPFVCHLCGRTFNQKVDLKIHSYTHTRKPAGFER